jgi:hypothetical protein
LSLRQLDDGRLLLHCFGGCDVSAVLGAVGFSLSELYPNRPAGHRRAAILPRPRVPAADLLVIAAREINVAWLLANRMVSLRIIEADDWPRLQQAVARLARIAAEVQRVASWREGGAA